jgi:hypothetical protein
MGKEGTLLCRVECCPGSGIGEDCLKYIISILSLA